MSELDSARYWLSWIELGSAVALFLVAIGVGYEFVANRLERPLRDKIDAAREAEIVRLGTESSSQQLEIAKAHERAAEANARAAEANEKAEHERLARIQIEEKIAPRRLSAQQQAEMATKLRAFHGDQTVAVFMAKLEPEIATLAHQIANVLHEAKWPMTLGVKTDHERIVIGVLVEVQKQATPHTWVLASTLVQVLQGEEVLVHGPTAIEQRGFTFQGGSHALEAPIHVTVGAKP